MKSFNIWKNEQIREKLLENVVPEIPTSINGDPNNAIPPNVNKPATERKKIRISRQD